MSERINQSRLFLEYFVYDHQASTLRIELFGVFVTFNNFEEYPITYSIASKILEINKWSIEFY